MNAALLKRFDFVMWTMIVVVILYITLVLFPAHLNHDAAWILYSSGEMLNGAEFGKDVLDINPPLMWWLDWPPALAAQALGFSPVLMFRLYVFAIIAVIIFLLKIQHEHLTTRQLVAIATALVMMPGYDFGQREHFMAILVLPYLLSAIGPMPEKRRGPARIMSGILAGIGICIKPHFLLIPVCVELFRLIRSRKIVGLFRCETVMMGMVGVCYVIVALIFAPDYFSDVVPAAMSNYGAYDNPLIPVIQAVLSKSVLVLLAVAALIFARTGWGISKGLLVGAIGAGLAAIAQSKGWNYHVLPQSLFLVLAVVLSDWGRKKVPAYFAGLGFAVAAVLIPAAGSGKDLFSTNGQQALINSLANRMKSTPGPHKVYAFTSSPRAIWPAIVAADAHWTGTAVVAYLLPAAINRRDDSKALFNAKRQLSRIAEVLRVEEPSLIIVNASKYQLAIDKLNFDYVKYLSNYPDYVNIFAGYREEQAIGPYRIFAKIPAQQ